MYPKLTELGPLTLHTYGFLLALAYLVSISLAASLVEKGGVPRHRAWDLGFVIVISAIIGSKLLLVLADLDFYLSQPSRFLSREFWQAGGVYYGGLIGAVMGSAIYIRKNPDLLFWRSADAASPAIALGQGIGRIGCFAAGCDYGKPANVPWAVTFSSEYAHQYVGVPLHVPLHPSQLYESLATFVMLVFLLWFYARRRFSGQVFCVYLALYGVIRFALEFYRGDVGRGFVFGGMLSTSQFISLIAIPLAIIVYQIRGRTADSFSKT